MLKAEPVKRLREPEDSKFRLACFRVVTSSWFSKLTFICVVVNMIILSLKWEGQSKEMTYYVELSNDLFTLIFLAEFILKTSAFGYMYFRESWNCLDCGILII